MSQNAVDIDKKRIDGDTDKLTARNSLADLSIEL